MTKADERLRSQAPVLPLPLPVFHMLLALSDGERHGYALKREILRRTNGKLNLGSGALYGSISRMLDQGLIEESDERPDLHLDDERRRYYRITAAGPPRGAGRSRASATARAASRKTAWELPETGVRRAVAGPIRYYRLLLKLYPARFREEFACAAWSASFRDEYREAHGAGQTAHVSRCGLWPTWAVDGPRWRSRANCRAGPARYAVRVYRRRTLVTTLALSGAGPRHWRHHGRLQRAECRAVSRLAVSRSPAPGGSPGGCR